MKNFHGSTFSFHSFLQLSTLPTTHVARVREFFAKYDRDRDGRITYEEFSKMLQFTNMPEQVFRRAHNMMRRQSGGSTCSNCSQNSSISFRDFIQLFRDKDELEACIEKRRSSMLIHSKSVDEAGSKNTKYLERRFST